MENLIEHFFVQFGYFPLPNIGMLKLVDKSAVVHFSENKMSAPVSEILILKEECLVEEAVSFVSITKNISTNDATALLNEFCNSLLNKENNSEYKVGSLGSFIKDGAGKLHFKQTVLEDVFFPDVPLTRVIHPNAIHQVRVGDTETTNAVMTELLNVPVKVRQSKWWIAAIVFTFISLSLSLYYFNNPGHNHSFGNATFVVPNEEPVTFKTVD